MNFSVSYIWLSCYIFVTWRCIDISVHCFRCLTTDLTPSRNCNSNGGKKKCGLYGILESVNLRIVVADGRVQRLSVILAVLNVFVRVLLRVRHQIIHGLWYSGLMVRLSKQVLHLLVCQHISATDFIHSHSFQTLHTLFSLAWHCLET